MKNLKIKKCGATIIILGLLLIIIFLIHTFKMDLFWGRLEWK